MLTSNDRTDVLFIRFFLLCLRMKTASYVLNLQLSVDFLYGCDSVIIDHLIWNVFPVSFNLFM